MGASGVVEVWRESSEFWRWRYTEPPAPGRDTLELLSNEVYESREEALKSATSAYPGTPVLELERPPGTSPEPARKGRTRSRRVLVLVGITLALLALRLRRRRQARSG